MVILGARSVLKEVAVAAGSLALARLLAPADFGVFAIVTFVLTLFRSVGEVGFGAVFIQRAEPPTRRELSTVFWFQLGLSLLLFALVVLLSEVVFEVWPELPPDAPSLLRTLAVSLVLVVLGAIPGTLLERELRYFPISVVELVGSVTFYGTAVGLAAAGLGTRAFVLAALAQSVTSLIALFMARPWLPSFVFDVAALRRVLPFGLVFQGKHFVAVLNDAVTPGLAGGVLGQAALGLNNFARGTALMPLHVVAVMGRVSFPLFSRLASDRRALAEELDFIFRLCGTASVGFSVLLVGLGPELVSIVYHPKWLPAMPALYIYSLALNLGFMAPIMAGAFEGLGRPQVVLRLATAWTGLNWLILVATLSFVPTLEAFALGYVAHMVIGNLVMSHLLKREVPGIHPIGTWLRAAAVGVAVVVATRVGVSPFVDGFWSLALATTLVLGGWLGISALVDPALSRSLRSFIERIRRRRAPVQRRESAADVNQRPT